MKKTVIVSSITWRSFDGRPCDAKRRVDEVGASSKFDRCALPIRMDEFSDGRLNGLKGRFGTPAFGAQCRPLHHIARSTTAHVY